MEEQRMIGMGIDTGGTYTDAVVYNTKTREILAAAKSRTTRQDLKIGIENAVAKLPEEALKKCRGLALSTTLATNACVEGKGGRGKLILIGVSKETFDETRAIYGMNRPEDVYFLDCKIDRLKERSHQPDWEAFKKDMKVFLKSADCVGVVQLFAKEHLGSYESEAREKIAEVSKIPVILGHELFPDLNVFRRGAGALLNARLVPVIYEFLTAVKKVFRQKGLAMPMLVARSDGSLMTERFTKLRPVETLLSGPAASVMGARELCDRQEAIIVDMGGTTTDVALVENGQPRLVRDGIQVGGWKTFVKGLYVDTFGLGGDTAVHYSPERGLFLEDYRVIPLCNLAANDSRVLERLKTLDQTDRKHVYFEYEFLTLLKEPDPAEPLTEQEKKIITGLQDGPIMLKDIPARLGIDLFTLKTERLEKRGAVLRSGVTPTDIMHINGDFNAFSKEASAEAAAFICRQMGISVDELCDKVYDLVEERLYCNLVRILYMSRPENPIGTDYTEEMELAAAYSYREAKKDGDSFFAPVFRTKAALVGVGGPIHLFLPKIAKMLGAESVIPEYAAVANAVGAIAGNILVTRETEIAPDYSAEGEACFRVTAMDERKTFLEYEDALKYAKKQAIRLAKAEARKRGAAGKITATVETRESRGATDTGSVFLGETVAATASGNYSKFSEEDKR